MDAVLNPTVSGPISAPAPLGDTSRNYPQFATIVDLASRGYVEEEYFFRGEATVYERPDTGILNVWERVEGPRYPYVSRMIVRRPHDANGVVILEWLNVTAGANTDSLWQVSNDYFMRAGYAYVGVSAQRVGIHQERTGLKSWSPARYGDLDVESNGRWKADELAFDIYAQAGKSVASPKGIDPLGGLPRERLLLATGASQSERFLAYYHNMVQPEHNLFQAYFMFLGTGEKLRTDLSPKVFKVNTENDVLLLREGLARQEDSDTLHTWEIAGASHVTYHTTVNRNPLLERDGLASPPPVCDQPAYSHIPTKPVLDAAFDHLVRWVKEGVQPPPGARIILEQTGDVSIAARDRYGNALGGIRLAEHEVATATNTGVNSGAGFCRLYGSHRPFGPVTLSALYPDHESYVSAVAQVTDANLKAGFILAADAADTKRQAEQSLIGR